MGAVGRLAARAAIREFEEGRRGPPCATAEEALALALRAGLVTVQTAFVAVERATGAVVGGARAAAVRAAEDEEVRAGHVRAASAGCALCCSPDRR